MNEIYLRRSIRKFEDKPIDREIIERLLRAGMQAPSGKNGQPWEFLVVTDHDDRLAIANMHEFAGMCRFAPVVIVPLVNTNGLVDDGVWWPQDMSACTQNILLQAVTEGLGTCWCGFYPLESRINAMREYFKLPDNIIPFSLIPVGYSERENKFIDRFDAECIHWGKY